MSEAAYVALVLDLVDGQGHPVTVGSVTLVPSVELTDAPDMMTIPPLPVTVELEPGVQAVASPLLASDSPGPSPAGWVWNISFNIAGAGIGSYPLFLPAGPAAFTAASGTPAVFTWAPPGAEPWQLQTLPNGTGVQVSDSFGPFTAGVTYYVVNASGYTAELAAAQAGPPIASASSGSGSITVVQYQLSALVPAQPVTGMAQYMLQPSGTPAARSLLFATGAGEGSAWGALEASDLPATGVTPGLYTSADITVDAEGRVTAAADGSAGGVTSFDSRTGPVTPQSGDYAAFYDAAGSAAAAQANAATYAAGVASAAQSNAEAASLQKSANLGDLASASTARGNLGLGSAAVQSSSAFDAAGSAAAAQSAAEAASDPAGAAATAQTNAESFATSAAAAAQAASLQKSANLSDLANAGTARTNLGLGTAALLASSAVAQTANNLSDLASAASARTNLGLGSAATQPSSAFDAAGAAAAAQAASTPVLTQTAVQTTTYTAAANQLVRCDTTSGAFTVTLPSAPAAGTLCGVKMVTQGGTSTVTVACGGSDVLNKTGGSTTLTLSMFSQGVLLQYNSGVWYVVTDDLPLAQLDGRYVPQSLAVSAASIAAQFTASGSLGSGSVSWTVQSSNDTLTSLWEGGTTAAFTVQAASGAASFTVLSTTGGTASLNATAQGSTVNALFKATSSSGIGQMILNGNTSTTSAQMVWQKNATNTWVMEDNSGGTVFYIMNNSGQIHVQLSTGNNASPNYDNALTIFPTKVTVNGTFVVNGGGAALATTATRGFIYVPTCAGPPTGTPVTNTGTVAIVFDTIDGKLYVYNGAWKAVALS